MIRDNNTCPNENVICNFCWPEGKYRLRFQQSLGNGTKLSVRLCLLGTVVITAGGHIIKQILLLPQILKFSISVCFVLIV